MQYCLVMKDLYIMFFGYSSEIEKLKKLVLHNPVTLTLTEVEGDLKDDIVPASVQQFQVSFYSSSIYAYFLSLEISLKPPHSVNSLNLTKSLYP